MKKGIVKDCLIEVDGVLYPISKDQKNLNLVDGSELSVITTTEYPESCDTNPFCEGDETCVICLIQVAVVMK
jgi:hypothetical protein